MSEDSEASRPKNRRTARWKIIRVDEEVYEVIQHYRARMDQVARDAGDPSRKHTINQAVWALLAQASRAEGPRGTENTQDLSEKEQQHEQ